MLFIFSTLVLIRHLQKIKTVIFLHWCLIHAALLFTFLKRGVQLTSMGSIMGKLQLLAQRIIRSGWLKELTLKNPLKSCLPLDCTPSAVPTLDFFNQDQGIGLQSGLLHLTDQPYCKKSRSAKIKDGIINLILRNYHVGRYSN